MYALGIPALIIFVVTYVAICYICMQKRDLHVARYSTHQHQPGISQLSTGGSGSEAESEASSQTATGVTPESESSGESTVKTLFNDLSATGLWMDEEINPDRKGKIGSPASAQKNRHSLILLNGSVASATAALPFADHSVMQRRKRKVSPKKIKASEMVV